MTTTSRHAGELPKIYTLQDILPLTLSSEFQDRLIQGIATGLVALDQGDFYAAPIQTLGTPPAPPLTAGADDAAQTCVKSGYFRNASYYVIKVASGGTPWPNSGLMQVYSQSTGRLVALLLDEGVLTELRTAAMGALAVTTFISSPVQKIGILGSGVQARYQLRMLANVLDCRNVTVWSRTKANVDKYCAEMTEDGWNMQAVYDPDELFHSDIIITTTSSRAPVLGRSVKRGVAMRTRLIVCIGSDAPGKTELTLNLVQQASLRVADTPAQSKERGEFQEWSRHCRAQGLPDEIVRLSTIIQNPGQYHKEQLVIVDSSGVALQDCVIAGMVVDALHLTK